jgi:sugar O-acyltransferase (sialic acid O-acetyltransferase NeuD family)
MKNIYLIGGGGHCQSVIDVVETTGLFKISGIFDKKENVGKKVFDYQIIGDDSEITKYVNKDNFFLITLGQIKSAELRRDLFIKLTSQGAQWATVISPNSYVSKRAEVGPGTAVLHNVVINAGARIGKNCIINTSSLIEHGSLIGDHCHVATAAVVNGDCRIGGESFIGSQSVLRQGLHLPAKSFVQAGQFINKPELK